MPCRMVVLDKVEGTNLEWSAGYVCCCNFGFPQYVGLNTRWPFQIDL